MRWSLRRGLEVEGYEVLEAGDGKEAAEALAEDPDVVLLDYQLPGVNGLELLARIRRECADAPVIMLTAFSSVEGAVEAMKLGAYHYARKPFDIEEIVSIVARALETTALRREVKALRDGHSAAHAFDRIIGESPAIRDARALLRKIASIPTATVLLTGESGTGKDLAAKVIHCNSDRAAKPFTNITCTALPEALLESELFGHERGAFTDAKVQKKGLLELADGGTVFLDEIGDMSLLLQAKLLRFLEDKTFRRVGGGHDIRVDVRVMAATNRNLGDAMRERQFREDLYYRLHVLPVHLPPLRERREDIEPLIKFYIDQLNRELRKNVRGVHPRALRVLEAHDWPGNVRELRNALERAMLLSEAGELHVTDFQMISPLTEGGEGGFRLPAQGFDFEDHERALIAQALDRCAGNQSRAAQMLGIKRDKLRYRMEKFGLGRAAEDQEKSPVS
ncbi:MAG: sigma-54-dependent Fis family transcriptional regulator [Myxococcales bacterium]|nr:sigma-54-dependent Fis family transcriptional regulator [Myxococcales bacterium]